MSTDKVVLESTREVVTKIVINALDLKALLVDKLFIASCPAKGFCTIFFWVDDYNFLPLRQFT